MLKNQFFGVSSLLTAGLLVFLTACGPSENGETADEPEMQDEPQIEDDHAEQQPQQPPQQQPQDMDVDVSDEELETFADILGEIEELQADIEGEMDEILEDEGLTMERYQELMMQQQQGMEGEEDADITEDERQQMQDAQERMDVLQRGMEEDAIDIMEDKGMSYERYQEIQMALQQDPELQQELMEHLDHPGGQGQPQQPPQ